MTSRRNWQKLPLTVVLASGAACTGFEDGGGASASAQSSTAQTNSPAATVTTSLSTATTAASVQQASATSSTGVAGELVTVVDEQGAPIAEARIVVNDAAGAVVLDTKASADGAALVDIPDGGSVTYTPPPTAEGDLNVYTSLAVPSGSPVRFVHRNTSPEPNNNHEPLTYNVATTVPANSTSFRLFGSCLSPFESTTAMFTVANYRGCPNVNKATFMLVAYDNSNRATAFGIQSGLPLPASGTHSLSFSPSTTAFYRKDWEVLSIPASALSYTLTVSGVDTAVAGLEDAPLFRHGRSVPSPPGSLAGYLDVPVDVEKATMTEGVIMRLGNPSEQRVRVVHLSDVAVPDWTPTTPSTPSLDDTFVDFSDLTQVRLRFEFPAQPPPADGVFLLLSQALTASSRRNHFIVAPAETAMRTVPALPDDRKLAYPAYQKTDVFYLHVDMTGADGYASFVGQFNDTSVDYSANSLTYSFQP